MIGALRLCHNLNAPIIFISFSQPATGVPQFGQWRQPAWSGWPQLAQTAGAAGAMG